MDVSAALQVVGTWEFVQRILLNLPLKQLFILQRVSKTFENVIKESPQIQRKMFLRADGAARSRERDRSSSTDEAIYQLGKLHLNPIFPPDLAGNLRAVIHDPHGPCIPNASRMLQGLNRCETLPPISLVLAHSQQRQCLTIFATMRSENGIKILYDRSRRRQMASWRRMFVAQPPVKSMVYIVGHRPYTPPIVREFVREEGLTFGDLCDFFTDHDKALVFSFGYLSGRGDFEHAIRSCSRWSNTSQGPCGCIKVLLGRD